MQQELTDAGHSLGNGALDGLVGSRRQSRRTDACQRQHHVDAFSGIGRSRRRLLLRLAPRRRVRWRLTLQHLSILRYPIITIHTGDL